MNWLRKLFTRKRKLYSFEPDYVVRPSQSILEAMEFAKVSVMDLNCTLYIFDIAYLLADEVKINDFLADKLSKVLGSSPEFWINLSRNYFEKKGGSDA